MSSEPIRTEVSWLLGSTGGTTPMPRRARLLNAMVLTGKFSYLPSCSLIRRQRQTGHRSPSILGAQHVLERLAQMARDQVQGLLEDRAALDHVHRLEILQAALEPLDQRALARADRAHQVEDLARLLAAHGGRMEVAHDLLERALHAEELVGEEVVDLDRLVAEHALGARVGLEVELASRPGRPSCRTCGGARGRPAAAAASRARDTGGTSPAIRASVAQCDPAR